MKIQVRHKVILGFFFPFLFHYSAWKINVCKYAACINEVLFVAPGCLERKKKAPKETKK